jgi:rRNA maturation endonuclease Nob1
VTDAYLSTALLGIAGVSALIRKTEPEVSTIKTVPIIIQKKYCISCGSELAIDVMFCPKCGIRQP